MAPQARIARIWSWIGAGPAPHDRDRCLAAGIDYASKPVLRAQLAAVLQRVVARSGLGLPTPVEGCMLGDGEWESRTCKSNAASRRRRVWVARFRKAAGPLIKHRTRDRIPRCHTPDFRAVYPR